MKHLWLDSICGRDHPGPKLERRRNTMKVMKCRVHFPFLLVAVCVFSLGAAAQGFRATITGRTSDESGAAVANAKITVTNVGTNESRTVQSSDTGDYTVPQLTPGEYTLIAEMPGFKKTVRRLVLETGQQLRIDVVLEVGSVTERVEVTATPP